MPEDRRHTIFVNKPLQGRIIYSITWPAGLCFAVSALGVLVLALVLGFDSPELEKDQQTVLPTVVMAACALLLATFFVLMNSIKVSHRVAGPMYRLRQTLHAVREGDLKIRARLRKDDFLHELAHDLNDFIAWLEDHPPSGLPEPTEAPEPAETASS